MRRPRSSLERVRALADGCPTGGGHPGGSAGTHRGTQDGPYDGSHDDEGSALVEAIVVIAVLLLPLLWIATALIRVEAASFAVRAAAREAARTYVTAASTGAGAQQANVAARLAFEDQKAPMGAVAISCTMQPCLTPGGQITGSAGTDVGLPFVPRWLTGATGLQIHLSSTHTEKVEQYGGQR